VKPRSLVVTFDDGHRDNLELALPILKKYGVPAVIYVTTGFVDNTIRSFWWYDHELIIRKLDRIELMWRGKRISWNTSSVRAKRNAFFELNSIFKTASPEEQAGWMRELREQAGMAPEAQLSDALSWEDVLTLDREPLITIGAHSDSHAVLSRIDLPSLNREMAESKRTLERKLGHPVLHFAYPFGDRKHAARREFETARECGFESACTTRIGHIQKFHADHLLSIPRMTIDYRDNMESFGWKLSGLDCLIKRPWSRFIAD
jgi:peptidoglycan/xylan/chitin deacetylase (PgdA/CDA1 family)